MIGIVVVSHSFALAQAAVSLASEMVQADLAPLIEVAAGLNGAGFGTDAAAVARAIDMADGPDGVLVLLDLGSAVLSAEMALEFVGPDVADRVRLSAAPLVEGLVAAVVTAAGGADLDHVWAEADRGLAAKQHHLAGATVSATPLIEDLGPQAVTRRVNIDIPHGLHARPAARFVSRVNDFSEATVQVRHAAGPSPWVRATSLSAVATLNIQQGHEIEIRAAGADAEQAVDALVALARAGFVGDPNPLVADVQHGDSSDAHVSDGDASVEPLSVPPWAGLRAAMGSVTRLDDDTIDPADYRGTGDPAAERARLTTCVAQASRELDLLVVTTRAAVGPQEADIFTAHLALLADAAITEPAFQQIDDGVPAAHAWYASTEAAAAGFENLDENYQRERAGDVRSVARRVLRALIDPVSASGMDHAAESLSTTTRPAVSVTEPQILVVPELDPATAIGLDPRKIAGVVTTAGGSTGHGVLLAHARGVPLLTGRSDIAAVATGTTVAFDADSATVWVDPDLSRQQWLHDELTNRADELQRDLAEATLPGRTQDGVLVPVKGNLNSVYEAGVAVQRGSEGAGLVRTEVMFASWSAMPTVDEQETEFRALAQALTPHSMTVRTWDIGADKPLSFWAQEPEQNPFLGVRGVRSFAADPSALRAQLQAVCRVARDYRVRLMFPMVSTPAEVAWLLGHLDEALAREGRTRPDGLDVGIMVEVPAAALRVAAMTAHLDFISIGTNDLTQYTMAAERGNATVGYLFDPLDPAVLTLIHQVCRDKTPGVQVGVCGGAASDPSVAVLLVGLGVDDLSVPALAVPRVKAALRRHTRACGVRLAQRALWCDGPHEVRALLADPHG